MQYNINTDESVNKMVQFARESAIKYNGGDVATEHLVYGILRLRGSKCCDLLENFGVSLEEFEDVLNESRDDDKTPKTPDFTPKSKQVLVKAQNLAKELKSPNVSVEHILFCILMSGDCVAVGILDKVFSVNIIELKNQLLEVLKQQANQFQEQLQQKSFEASKNQQSQAKPQQNVASQNTQKQKESEDPLANLGIDLTEKARVGKIDTIIGRDKEIERVIEILCRKTKNNPCLIGEAGVGKSAIVEGLATKIISGDVPPELRDKTIFSFDIAGLMSGTKYRGALEQKMKSAIKAILQNGNVILFIDEIHTLAQTSSEKGSVSPADILKPYLARGEIKTIGATTTDEYQKYIERDKALERRFQPVKVEPPNKQDTYQILKGLREGFEAFHGVKINDSALKASIELSDRYITSRNFPDKAIDLVDEACSRAKMGDASCPSDIQKLEAEAQTLQKQKKQCVAIEDYETAITLREKIFAIKNEIERLYQFYGISDIKKVVGAEDIAHVVSLWTSIPVTKLTQTETQKLLNLEEILHARVVGQSEAVESVARAIRRNRVGLKSSNRPIGSFLFLGPTGVGKTELCKAVAEALFDDENNMIRLDMSEYMEANSVAKLVGSAPGYVGYEAGGQLTERVRKKPYSVVLFDEIEKANLDVLNILLQILDEGKVTDNQGRSVSFQNTIIIMTSNVGSFELQKLVETATSDTERDDTIQKYLTNYFRPELVNRIDKIVLFKSLDRTSLAQIAKIMLTSLVKTLNGKNIGLKLTENALAYLIDKGYNKEFGARPLRRLIEQEIEAVISEAILRGDVKSRSNISIDEVDGKLAFDYQKK